MRTGDDLTIVTRKPRLEQIQFLRFLAFFCVYVAHAEVWLFFPFPSVNCSTSAVGFFFVLSGFLTGYNSSGKEIRLSCKGYLQNLWKRIKKVYPLYLITMLIPAFTSNVLYQISVAQPDGNVVQLVKNLLMIQSWFPEGSMSFNGVGWFISTLMFMNALTLPAVFVFEKASRHRRSWLILPGMIAGILFATAVYCYATKTWDLAYWHYVFPPARLGEYLSGIGLGYWVSMFCTRIKLGKHEKWIFTFLEIGALLFAFRFMYVWGSPWRVHILNWLIPNFILITVFAMGRGWVSCLFRHKWLVRLGDISFECFLVHNLLVVETARKCEILGQTQAGKVVGFTAIALLTVLISMQLNKPQKA